jgi:RIO kinase 1
MRIPDSLLSLADEGIIDEVLRPLMSGKEAQVYLVRSMGALRVAKVYKDADQRSFKQRADYTEGRNVRNTRDQRAIGKRTRYGREQDEAAWRSAEVDMIYRLQAAGVRVPVPYHFVDGVLIMELVTDAAGHPAPRLGDLKLDAASASAVFDRVLAEVIRMLAAGVVHGDLSDFNVLMGSDGPVIIDFPQAVNAAGNQNARKLLLRDVDNLHRFISKYIPGRRPPPFAQEMWQLYERGELSAETKLNGRYRAPENKAATADVLSLVAEAERDERRRREALGQRMRGGSSAQNHPARGQQTQQGSASQQRPSQHGSSSSQQRPSSQRSSSQQREVQVTVRPAFGARNHPAPPRPPQQREVQVATRRPPPPAQPQHGAPQHNVQPQHGAQQHRAPQHNVQSQYGVQPQHGAAAPAGGDAAPKRKRRRRRRKSKAGSATVSEA